MLSPIATLVLLAGLVLAASCTPGHSHLPRTQQLPSSQTPSTICQFWNADLTQSDVVDGANIEGVSPEILLKAQIRFGPHSLRRTALCQHLHQTFSAMETLFLNDRPVSNHAITIVVARLLSFGRFFHLFHHQKRLLCVPVKHHVDTDELYAACLKRVVDVVRTPQEQTALMSIFLGDAQFLEQTTMMRAASEQLRAFLRFRSLMDETLEAIRLFLQQASRQRNTSALSILEGLSYLANLKEEWAVVKDKLWPLIEALDGDEITALWVKRAHSFKKHVLLALADFIELLACVQTCKRPDQE